MPKPPRFSLWIFMLIVFFAVLLISPDSDAGGNDIQANSSSYAQSHVDNNQSVGDTVSNTTVQGDKNKALALGHALGDVDIAQCLGSTQWSTPLYGKQKLVLNWPCMTEFYLRNRMYENAAMAICNTEIRDEFASEEACRAAHPFKKLAEPAPLPESPDEDEEDDYHQQLEDAVAALRLEFEQTQAKAAEAKRTAQRAANKPQTVIQKEEFLDEDKRAKLEALKHEAVD